MATSGAPEDDAFRWRRQASNHAQDWYDGDAAKSVSSFDNAVSFSDVTPPELVAVPAQLGITVPRRQSFRDNVFMVTAYAIAAVTWDRVDEWKGNKVACILVDPNDRIVSWGINMKDGQNVTWHGETVTLRRYLHLSRSTHLNPGYRLYTTLKPCYMCAGMVAEVADSMTIIYGQDDPEIRNSKLDRDRASYPQSPSTALFKPGETFPSLLQRLITQVGGTAIPFLENLTPDQYNTSFGRALRWFKRICQTIGKQYLQSDEVDRRLGYLDLALPDKREAAANVYVLYQALALLQAIGAKVARLDI